MIPFSAYCCLFNDCRVADFCLELEQELILSLFGFIKNVSSRFQSRVLPLSDPFFGSHIKDTGLMDSYATVNQLHLMTLPVFNESHKPRLSLPSIVPIGAPWQQIYLLARRQKKIYVEVFDLCPINLTLRWLANPLKNASGIVGNILNLPLDKLWILSQQLFQCSVDA